MYFGKFDRAIANPERDFLLKEHFVAHRVIEQQHQGLDSYIDYTDIKDYISNIQNAIVAYYKMQNPLESEYSDSI